MDRSPAGLNPVGVRSEESPQARSRNRVRMRAALPITSSELIGMEMAASSGVMWAITASGRKVLRILAAFPVFFLVVFLLIYPSGTMALFPSTAGQVVLAIVIALVFCSVRWGNKILAFDY